jgi:guanine deaminase
MSEDMEFLIRAVEIAREGIKNGTGPFGAVIAKGNKIVSEAVNRVVLDRDPTAHAEILAIREACAVFQTHFLEGYTLYTSCEPCPMCLGAVYWAGIKRVVYCSDSSEAAEAGFSDKMIYDEIAMNPSERTIEFLRIRVPGGKSLFQEWNEFEKRVQY